LRFSSGARKVGAVPSQARDAYSVILLAYMGWVFIFGYVTIWIPILTKLPLIRPVVTVLVSGNGSTVGNPFLRSSPISLSFKS